MPNYTIDLTIFRLKLLLSDTHNNPILSELETRFSTANIYPPFDPTIHTPVDWDQLSLSTDRSEDVLLPLNEKLVEDVESVEAELRVRDWTRDVARRMGADEGGDDGGDSGHTATDKSDIAPNDREDSNSDTNENDQFSHTADIHNKRDYQTDSETDHKPGKRRRSARIAAQHGSSSNT